MCGSSSASPVFRHYLSTLAVMLRATVRLFASDIRITLALRRPRRRFGHSRLSAMLAALVLGALQIILFWHDNPPLSAREKAALQRGIDLRADQDGDSGEPQPGHEADHGAKRAVGLVVGAEIGCVPGKQGGCGQP